ncbi:NUDIX hydrolase [Spiroplasma endosymbiont of Acasis viretata]|uniref:NUDIX hydrolase n=1 Tax=Spiroplasma endosymbiont of Acasis viretata TaxID=3066306 RepID=UPI00313ADB12
MNKEYLKLIKVEFMHGVEEPWCNNQGVAILPYVLKDNEFHYLLTKEYNPLFKNKKISEYSTITGGLENNNHYQTVIKEMLEETGIDVRNEKIKIHYLGKHYANKSSTKLWYFYGIDLSKLGLDLTAIYNGTGDGVVGGGWPLITGPFLI